MTKKMFLSGSMRNGWREKVKEALKNIDIEFIEPHPKGSMKYPDYVFDDFDQIDKTDILFVYLRPDNLSGKGMSAEMGYAYANKIPIIFVNDQPGGTGTDFLEAFSHWVFYSLEGCFDYIERNPKVLYTLSPYVVTEL